MGVIALLAALAASIVAAANSGETFHCRGQANFVVMNERGGKFSNNSFNVDNPCQMYFGSPTGHITINGSEYDFCQSTGEEIDFTTTCKKSLPK